MRIRCVPLPLLLFLLAAVAGQAGAALGAETCIPADPPPSSLWNELEPGAVVFNTTCFNEDQEPGCLDPTTQRAFAAAVENDRLYLVTGNELAIFDVQDPGQADRLNTFCRPLHGNVRFSKTDANYYYVDVAVENGLAAMAVQGSHGLVVMDFSDPVFPGVTYQDAGWDPWVVAASGGKAYVGFVGGTRVYDLAAVGALAQPCLDQSGFPGSSYVCGVYLGTLPTLGFVSSISAGAGLLAVATRAFGGGAAQLWDTSAFLNPRLLLELGGTLAAALWDTENGTYLASLSSQGELAIREVGCLAAGSCSSPQPPLATADLNAGVDSLRVSQSQGHTLLWAGSSQPGSNGGQPGYAFLVTQPSRPRDLSPPGYWEHYDQFSWVWPARAILIGEHLYRTAFGLFDVHRWSRPPAIFADGFEPGDASGWSCVGDEDCSASLSDRQPPSR